MPDTFPRAKSGALRTKRLSDGNRELTDDLKVEMSASSHIRVKQGFVTDFSSVPAPLQWIVLWSRVDIAGVVHDWLYDLGDMSRAEADRIWRQVALAGEHHATWIQAWICWIGLRALGWWPWYKHRARDRREAAAARTRSRSS